MYSLKILITLFMTKKKRTSMIKRKTKLSQEEYLNFINVNVSNEYNALDWKEFLFGGLAKAYHAIASNATITIDNPGVMIGLFTGKWTTVGKIVTLLRNDQLNFLWDIVNLFKGKGTRATIPTNIQLGNTPNMYKILFVDYKKINFNNLERYKKDFDLFKQAITGLKGTVCRQRSKTKASVSQISDLKIFRPTEIAKEMAGAISYMEEKGGKEWEEFGQSCANYITTSIVKYLLDNIKDPNGYIKR